MDKQTKTNVKNLVLSLRDDFEKEIENRLSHIGIYKDREWKDGRSLPHLAEDELGRKELDKRRRVAAFIKREEKLGLSLEEATSEFIKECSYTWINRLLGLKCMECQGIIEEVITTRPEFSNRSRAHRDFRETHPDIASKADDGLTATLFSVFEQVTDEIKILFDPSNEYSLIIPRYAMLKKSIEKINTELDYETYRADDFLGWVYQYFNSREKEKTSEEVKLKDKKISGTDIINVTQLYTEKYMVKFLVENSLGAMWTEMKPDSDLPTNWKYFVKHTNKLIREQKPVKEITFLDPACGSGHFLLYAFDIYYEMYLEENAVPRKEIPDYILKYNLHGIDIDQRAIQLTGLGLYMKAKSKNPDMKVHHMNLVSADAIMKDKEILDEFLQEFESDRTAQKLIRTIWDGLENVRELGSLLKIAEQIDEVIEQKKDKRLDFYDDATQKNWDQWKQEILEAIKSYYKKASLSFDLNKQMFANEAYKGVQLLDLLEQKYDIVATNPPYLALEKMHPKLSDFLNTNYEHTKKDIYAAFMLRNLKLVSENGKVSMINISGFMFQDSFSLFRRYILKNYTINILTHLGYHAFEGQLGHDINTSMFIFQKSKSDSNSVFFRVTNESYNEKNDKILSLIDKYNGTDKLENVFQINQRFFLDIEKYPFMYWVSPKVLHTFNSNKKMSTYLKSISKGITVTPTDKTIRCWWEIQDKSRFMAATMAKEQCRYYGHLEYSMLLTNKISKSINSRKINETECLVYNETSRLGFGVRIKPVGFANEFHTISIKPKNVDLSYLCGFLNSYFVRYILTLLNDTNRFCIDDIKRIPFKEPTHEKEIYVSKFEQQCVSIKRENLSFKLNDRNFSDCAIQWGYNQIKGG